MTEIQQERSDILPEDVNVGDNYGMGRSFRRSTEVRSLKTRVQETLISAINKWRKIEQAKGTCPRFSMLEHYVDVVLIMETIFQFSRPLQQR